MKPRTLPKRLWYRLLQRIFQLTGVIFCGVRHVGCENMPSEGGVLLVSNHQSHLDPPLIGMGIHRQMNYLARQSLFKFAPFRWMCYSLDAIPLDQDGIGLSGIRESLRRLKRGEIVVIFPEGSRTHDGKLAPFRPGFTALAIRAKAAILPAAIDGAYDAWPRTSRLPRLGRVHVYYGKPIFPSEYAGWDEQRLLAETKRRVGECLAHSRQHLRFSGESKVSRPGHFCRVS